MDRPQALRRGDWVMRPGFGVQGARKQSHAHRTLFVARACIPKPQALGPGRRAGFKLRPWVFGLPTTLNRTP